MFSPYSLILAVLSGYDSFLALLAILHSKICWIAVWLACCLFIYAGCLSIHADWKTLQFYFLLVVMFLVACIFACFSSCATACYALYAVFLAG
jgi:hypothetical protein